MTYNNDASDQFERDAASAAELTSQERRLYTAISDALIPSYETNPSASDAHVPTRWIDEALRIRPDLVAPFRNVLAAFDKQGVPIAAEDVFARLEELTSESIGALGTLTAGAYFLNPTVRGLIGYPGQESREYSTGADLPYLDMLERVVERGEIFQPTVKPEPANDGGTRSPGGSMSDSNQLFIKKESISLRLALQAIDAAISEAQRVGGAFSIVVMDDGGHVTASARMDGAALSSLQVAADKAYTVAATGFTPTQWYEYAAADPRMASGVRGMERVVTFDGGLPVVAADSVIGAIGVSGGHYEQDLQVATAAAQATARLLGEVH